jgi:hypothetical protein
MVIVPCNPHPLFSNVPDKVVSVSVIIVPLGGSIVPVSVLLPSARSVPIDMNRIPERTNAAVRTAFVLKFVREPFILVSFLVFLKQSLV